MGLTVSLCISFIRLEMTSWGWWRFPSKRRCCPQSTQTAHLCTETSFFDREGKGARRRWLRCRDQLVYAPSQWEMTLQCNVVSHWLGILTKWSQRCNLAHRQNSCHFADDIFELNFLMYFDKNFIEICSQGSANNKTSLVPIMDLNTSDISMA